MKLDTPKKKFIFASLVILIIILLIVVIVSGGDKEKQPTGTGTSATPTPVAGSVGTGNLGGVAVNEDGEIDTEKPEAKWETYVLDRYTTLKLPPQVEISSNDNKTTIGIGLDNGSLEISKDINLQFYTYNTNGRSVSQIAQSDLNEELSDFVELLVPVTAVTFGDNSGYYYSIKGMGQTDIYYFSVGEGKYLKIVSYPQDPDNNLAAEIVDNILSSLEY